MLSVRSKAQLHVTPAQVWELFHQMERRYLDWHPAHLGWQDLRGTATEQGSVVFADERVGRLRLRTRFFIDEISPGRRMAFRMGFPFSLLHAGGSFELEPGPGGGCVLSSETHFGARSRLGARLLDPLLRRVFPLETLERHLREEGDGLEQLAAAPVVSAPAPAARGCVTARVRFFVARSPEEVFDYFADLRNEPRYNAQVGEIAKTSPGPIGLDTTFEGRHAGFGGVTWRLTGWDRPRRVVIDGIVGGGRYRWVGDLQPSEGGTIFEGRMQWELPRCARPLRWLVERALSWNARRSFRRFKSVLEAGAEPRAPRMGLLALLRYGARNARYFRAVRLKDRIRTELCLANMEIAKLDPAGPLYAARVREYDAAMVELHEAKWFATDAARSRDRSRWSQAFAALRRAGRLARALRQGLERKPARAIDIGLPVLESRGTEIHFADGVPLVPEITPIVILRGSDFEMGAQYARQLVEIFGRWILERHAGLRLSPGERTELGRWEEQHRRHTPWLLDFCRGWASGASEAGVPMSYEDVLDLWVGHQPPAIDYLGSGGIPELPPLACSGAAAWGSATADGKLVTGSTGDHDLSFQVTLVAFPENGRAFIYSPFGATGEIGGAGRVFFFGHPAINSSGLAYVHHGGGPKFLEPRGTWGYGIRRGAAVIHALRFCDTAREVQALERGWPIGDVGFGDQNTVGGFWADDRYGYVCEGRREPVAIREAGLLGETDFLFANNSVAHPRAIESEWMAKERDRWTWDEHGGWRPAVPTGMKKSLGLFLAFARGRLSLGDLLGRGLRYAYGNSCARNRFLFEQLDARKGRLDVEAMKEVYRTGGTIPPGPWRKVAKDFVERGAWGKVSAAHASNAMTVVTQPSEGRYCLCTGPARRGLAPMMPNAAIPIRAETNAFWEIRLGPNPTAMVREAATLARTWVAHAREQTALRATPALEQLLERAVAELTAAEAIAVDGAPVEALSRALRHHTRAQVRAQQMLHAVAARA